MVPAASCGEYLDLSKSSTYGRLNLTLSPPGWYERSDCKEGSFIFFHNKRHPAEMAEPEIGRFLSSLATDGHVSASTQNQAFNALLFLYNHVLSKKIGLIDGVVRAKRPQRLPVVLTKDEVKKVIDRMSGAPRLMAILLYDAGLRLMECCHLRIKDIDFSRNEIMVRAGKGDKDRHTMLPGTVRDSLFQHFRDANCSTTRILRTG